MDSRTLIKELTEAGWKVVRIKGSHHQMRHPENSSVLTVPHPKKDLPKGLVNAIRKQAGLKR